MGPLCSAATPQTGPLRRRYDEEILMNRLFLKSSIVLILLFANTCLAGPDYEAMLQHQLPRISSGLHELARTKNEVTLEFECVVAQIQNRIHMIEQHAT